MTSHALILTSGLIAMASGFPALVLPRSNAVQALTSLILLAGNAAGAFAVRGWWMEGPTPPGAFPSPFDGLSVGIAIDGVSAAFLVPVLLVTSLASIYGLGYWRQSEHPENGVRVGLFLGLLSGAMTVIVTARDGLMFLAGWETMAVAAFFLVAAEDHIRETRMAAWLYLAASHLATLCAFGTFLLLYAINGTYEFVPIRETGTAASTALVLLALVGFGTKAGIMPLHVWLPSAHAQAPSHVSAVMSGLLIKMGIYGLVRVAMLVPDMPAEWGLFVLAIGTVSAILGVAFAVGQHDIKRLLAYHSIENIGIIVMGLGLALVGRSVGNPVWTLLGISGAILHVWNHALFKSLLFLGAGSVIHGAGTREIDRLGGLGKRMPVTATCFLIGAVAICGLPPLNGFVSELLIYIGLFRVATGADASTASVAALAAPGLALVGALAVACFVKVHGIVFLGAPRTPEAAKAHESSFVMLGPMAALAACCVVIGVVPLAVAPILDVAAAAFTGGVAGPASLAESAPLAAISGVAGLFAGFLAAGALFLGVRGVGRAPRSLTWDCGYAAPSARMQYTSSSFAETLVHLFSWALRPETHRPAIKALFPDDAHFESHVRDTVLEKALFPLTRGVLWLFSWARYLQAGNLQASLMYILAVILFLLLWR